MSTTLNFKDGIDLPQWRPLATAPFAHGNNGGGFCIDMRTSEDRIPVAYSLVANAVLQAYNCKNDEWIQLTSPGLTGTFGAGATAVIAPSLGPRGTLAPGATFTSVVLSTALPASVGVNQLANRGDGVGFKLRIYDNAGGASGRTAEVNIVGNTSGTTPTIYVASSFGFTPASGSTYEILSGRVFMLGASTNVAGQWKYYDIATNSYSGNLSVTNLPAAINTDSTLVALDELYTPYTQAPGTGFLGNIVASASTATTITGQVAGGDWAVLTNEYRNFQIRIVQDTGTPTSVGQRRVITSHTAGAGPVYTVPTWTVTPSAAATFVIENPNFIFLWSSGVTTTYTYASNAITGGGTGAAGLGADTWSNTLFATRGTLAGPGVCAWQPFGMTLDTNKNARYSFIYSFSGSTSSTLDLYDIAGAAAGSSTAAIVYGGSSGTGNFASGSCAAYESYGINKGRYTYLNRSGLQRNLRFDNINRVLEPWCFMPYPPGVAGAGSRMGIYQFFDSGVGSIGSTIQMLVATANMFSCVNQR